MRLFLFFLLPCCSLRKGENVLQARMYVISQARAGRVSERASAQHDRANAEEKARAASKQCDLQAVIVQGIHTYDRAGDRSRNHTAGLPLARPLVLPVQAEIPTYLPNEAVVNTARSPTYSTRPHRALATHYARAPSLAITQRARRSAPIRPRKLAVSARDWSRYYGTKERAVWGLRAGVG